MQFKHEIITSFIRTTVKSVMSNTNCKTQQLAAQNKFVTKALCSTTRKTHLPTRPWSQVGLHQLSVATEESIKFNKKVCFKKYTQFILILINYAVRNTSDKPQIVCRNNSYRNPLRTRLVVFDLFYSWACLCVVISVNIMYIFFLLCKRSHIEYHPFTPSFSVFFLFLHFSVHFSANKMIIKK